MAKSITSPRGTIGQYARLVTPDTKFNADGEFKANHTVPYDKNTKAFIAKLEAAFDEAYKAECLSKGKKSLKRADVPWEIDEDEGTVTFKYKLKHTIVSKKSQETIKRRVKLYDAKGKLIPNVKSLRIGAGTIAKFAFQPYFWFSPSVGFGLQLQMEAVQIITLVEYESGGHDFAEEDGDFSADDVDGDSFSDERPEGADDEDDEDDDSDF